MEEGRDCARTWARAPVPAGLWGFCCSVEVAARERETLERKGVRRRNAEENSLVVVDVVVIVSEEKR